jgi:hypothetical protein
MKCSAGSLIRLSIATLLGAGALLWSGNLLLNTQSSFVSSAEAIIGHPLTPMSYAGVARRTTAAAGVGIAAGAVYGEAVYGADGGRGPTRGRGPQLRAGRGSLRMNLYVLLLIAAATTGW